MTVYTVVGGHGQELKSSESTTQSALYLYMPSTQSAFNHLSHTYTLEVPQSSVGLPMMQVEQDLQHN